MEKVAGENKHQNEPLAPSVLWVGLCLSLLGYASLWLVVDARWHLVVLVTTLILLGYKAHNPLKQYGYLLLLVLFLLTLQLLFSPFIRELFLRSVQEGFHWSDWMYLLLAIERFALPLAMVASFQEELSRPRNIIMITALLKPLAWLGLKINKLQMLIVLALKFMPGLRREWDRFQQFQDYFVKKLPRRSLLQRLAYWQTILKAMIAHTLHQAVVTGDLLALKGLPHPDLDRDHRGVGIALILWAGAGAICWILGSTLFAVWIGLTGWLVLTHLSTREGSMT